MVIIKVEDDHIGDSEKIEIIELDLVEIGAQNWICEDGGRISELLKKGVLILTRFPFGTIFGVAHTFISFVVSAFKNVRNHLCSCFVLVKTVNEH